ncbi:hypothetical protein [Cryobacterium sp. Y11]|nr:hypothetical protein [Cryobacterium sp. Y11]
MPRNLPALRTDSAVDGPAAASQLVNGDYYRYIWANKPAWQGI